MHIGVVNGKQDYLMVKEKLVWIEKNGHVVAVTRETAERKKKQGYSVIKTKKGRK